MRENFADGVRVEALKVGIRRFVAVCDVHPEWKPAAAYERGHAVSDAEWHSRDVHDGVDYDGMPAELVAALRDVMNVDTRRRLATAARKWARRERLPEPLYYQCRDCSYGTYGVEDFRRHATEEGHVLEIAGEA
jgi:hypothetical protein